MNKFVQGALSVAVGLAAFYGVRSLGQLAANREPTAEELSKRMDDLRARATREHPGMATTDAMKEVAAQDAAKKLATQTRDQQTDTAAGMFMGFYWTNTKGRVAYCAQRGIDLTPFTTAFAKEHSAELERANAVFSAAGVAPETLLPKVMPELTKVVEQDMKDVTAGAKVPLDQACDLFNENAEQFAKLIQMPPHVKQALMAN
ncbi:hypothetical protein [Lysobacter terrae]